MYSPPFYLATDMVYTVVRRGLCEFNAFSVFAVSRCCRVSSTSLPRGKNWGPASDVELAGIGSRTLPLQHTRLRLSFLTLHTRHANFGAP